MVELLGERAEKIESGAELNAVDWLPSELPNIKLTCCNSMAWSLSWTRSPGDAFPSAVCICGVERSEESSGDELSRVCSRFERLELVQLTEPMDRHLQ